MKAITVHQPWAALIACGVKTIETRSWQTSYRGPLAIHAGQKGVEAVGRDLPRGSIIAIATLREIVPAHEATVGDADRALGDFTEGRYAWMLDDVLPVEPVEARGNFGIWEVPDELRTRLRPLRGV